MSAPELLCFVSGTAPHPLRAGVLYTACALGSHGKWVGGSVSGESPEACWRYLRAMEPRFRERWSAEFTLRWTTLDDPAVRAALKRVFEKMP